MELSSAMYIPSEYRGASGEDNDGDMAAGWKAGRENYSRLDLGQRKERKKI